MRPDRSVRKNLILADPLPWLAETDFALQRLLNRTAGRSPLGRLAEAEKPGMLSDLSSLRSTHQVPHTDRPSIGHLPTML